MDYEFLGAPILAPLTIEPEQIQQNSDTLGLRAHTQVHAAQRWRLSFSVQATGLADAALSARLEADRGGGSMPMPQHHPIQPGTGAAWPVARLAPAGTRTVAVAADDEGVPSSGVEIGRFVQLAGHSKIYRCTANDPGAAGTRELSLWPSLVEDVPAGDALRQDPTLHYLHAPGGAFGATFADGMQTAARSVTLLERV